MIYLCGELVNFKNKFGKTYKEPGSRTDAHYKQSKAGMKLGFALREYHTDGIKSVSFVYCQSLKNTDFLECLNPLLPLLLENA